MNRRRVALAGADWHLGAVPRQPWGTEFQVDWVQVDRWRPAIVPGNVRSALLAQSEVPDPLVSAQCEASAWVDDRDWWYIREFDLPLAPDERVHLVCEGIDYRSAIFLDDQLIAQHEGMFSHHVHDLTPYLAPSISTHTLAVRVWGSDSLPGPRLSRWERVWAPLASRLQGAPAFPDRMGTLKCQMSFGWDFAPRLRTMGIWDDVYLVVSRGVFIRDAWVHSEIPSPHRAVARVHLTLDADTARSVQMAVVITSESQDISRPLRFTRKFDLHAGSQEVVWDLPIESPRLWSPWDHGQPHLYRLTMRAFDAAASPSNGLATWLALDDTQPLDSLVLDSYTTTFGVRSVRLARNPATPADREDWTFVVNDRPVFIRGANWVPVDALPGRARRADYAALIDLARAVGINMFRVWGGGLREKADFYDLCDRAGILVWQEFPLACAFLDHYPRDAAFRDLLADEAAGIVQALRGRPSLVLWCGGNEFSPHRNRALVETVRQAVTEHDGSRPFHPVSPARGDSHNWRVWHGLAPVSEYQRDQAQFASEFGLQAAPDVLTLRGCLPPDELWPPGPAWTDHKAELVKLDRYAAAFAPDGLGEYVTATQKAQAYGLQVAIEHHRRRKYRCSGVLFWQFNEPWPAISWSVIDHDRRPKLAYHKLTQLYNPVLVSLEYPLRAYAPGETWRASVWLINDLPETIADCALQVTLDDVLVHQAAGLVLHSDSCDREAAMVACTLPADGPWLLRAELRRGEEVVAVSEYDLRYHDEQPVSRWVYWRSRIGEWLMEH
ncbi:MAG: hypothetical protein KKA73_24605 [Chloroflexi bacterium]|nr:hypothetical protein [Chloroflexota bacterium]MBU1750876.1 hypothetical protein [Chloroflexota bacterium]